MLLRVCLILAILAGVGAVVLSQIKVRPHIQGIIDQREDFSKRATAQETRAKKAEKGLKETQGVLEDTKTKLGETETQLTAEKGRSAEQEKRAVGLQENLEKTKQDLTSAQRDLSAWKALGAAVETVKAVIDAEKKLRGDIEALGLEKKLLATKLARTTEELDKYRGLDQDVVPLLPAGTRGKVLVVDPKWDFVVLDIGRRHEIVENGVLMVSRNGRLVAKIKIVNVQAERSIANVMPGWKLGEIMEGDQVLY